MGTRTQTRVGTGSVNANDAVAFVVELAALAVLCAWGVRYGGTAASRWLLGLGLPAAAALLWGLFAAPRARYGGPVTRLLVKLLVLGGAVVASFGVLPIGAAAAFAVVVAVNVTLMYAGPFARGAREAG